MDKARLPIKVVTPGAKDWHVPTSGGSAKKVFSEIDDAFRVTLASQVEEVGSYFSKSFSAFPFLPAVAVVKLHPDALAKSHRPDSLFRGTGCNIIGSRHSGELLIAVQDRSLSLLGDAIRKWQTKTAIANMSTITEIIPYTSRDALQIKIPDSGKVVTVKLKPFLHYSGRENAALSEHMDAVFRNLRCSSVARLNCYGRSTVLRLERLEAEQVIGLASFVGTRSLAEFPVYRALRMSSRRLGPATPGSFTPPDDAGDYPVLGVVDSGVDPGSSLMSPWIAARMCSVAETDCDYSHGTFVGALAIQPRILNNLNPCFPAAPCKILDVVVFPRSGELPENELLQAIDDALRAYPNVRVWNLSLSSNIPCSDSGFSDLAMALDELQDEFDVTFVIAAGNYTRPPFRGWPAENLGEDDRLGSPGDSARGITVGSLAHLESPTSRVRRDHPSPFSRRGPGAAFHPKPELTHYAGNCDTVGNCIQTGVVSLDGSDYLVEDVGTSYAVPLVASSLATIHNLTAERLSTNLGKALLIHSAVLGRKIAKESERAYYGFGVPDAVERVLTCTGSSVTLVFEPELRGSTSFEKSPFPFPSCLRLTNGLAFGDIMITLVYDPPLDSAWGLEYCRANVEVSLGSFDLGKEGKREHHRLIPPDETDYRRLYERELVKNGFKWSPVKVYRRRLNRVDVERWRLVVSAEFRERFGGKRFVQPALVITISDPNARLPVYDEVVRAAQQEGWIIDDLRLKQQIRATSAS